MMARKKSATEAKLEELFEHMKALTDAQMKGVLAFLCGWCSNDEHFVRGLERYLRTQHPEVF
jgi:hypothetical protein